MLRRLEAEIAGRNRFEEGSEAGEMSISFVPQEYLPSGRGRSLNEKVDAELCTVPHVLQPPGSLARIGEKKAFEWLYDLPFGRMVLTGAARCATGITKSRCNYDTFIA